jgi:hypothetical protein
MPHRRRGHFSFGFIRWMFWIKRVRVLIAHISSFKKHPAAAESAKKLPRFNDRATGCVLFRSFADSVLNIA